MGILSTNKKIINLGQGYSAGNGISIDDYVISYTGNEGQLYSAGQNIDIYDDQGQLYISGKDWSADIANASSNAYEQATALIPPEFDPSYISGVIDNKLDSTAFSNVSGDFATTSYVDMSDDLTYSRATAWADNQGYLKEHQPISADQWNSSYETVLSNSAQWGDNTGDEEVNSFVYDNSATINDVNTSYIQNSGTFLTAHQVIQSAKWEDASDVVQSNSAQWSENTGDEEVNNAVYNNSANWNDITVYQTNSASYLTAHQDISNKLDTTAFSTVSGTFLTAHQDLSNYATTGDLNTASGILSGAIDYLSGNAGKTYTGISPIVVNNDTNEISADSQDITFGSGLDFTNGVLTVTGAGTTYTGDAQGALDEVYTNSGVWLTAHQPISANEWNSVYETVETNSGSWAGGGTSLTGDAQGAVDEVYSNSANWNSNYSTVNANSGSWGGTPLPMSAGEGIDIQIENDTLVISATGGAGNPEVESYVQTNSASIDEVVGTYETNSGTYLTAHQDLSDYATTGDVNDLAQSISETYQPIGDYLTTADSDNFYPMTGNPSGFISEIPTGVMVESACEYNAVNEISAYNGSAIAQYGAEKQWLQHDDTIVHVANSAQYAFGVNLSALQRLMGIDETVLWSGNATYTNLPLTLNEPMSSFNTIKFYWQTFNYNAKNWTVSEKIPVGIDNYYSLFDGIYNVDTKTWFDVAFAFKEENGKLNYVSGAYTNWANNTVGNASGFIRMFKVVGIGRKQ